MLIVGAFPPNKIREHGGILTSCRVLLASSLPERMDLILVDSSSSTVPPPPFLNRLGRAVVRVIVTLKYCLRARPDVMLLFASPGASFIEKSIMAAIARTLAIKTLMFPRGAALVTQYRSSRLGAILLGLCFRIPTLMLCQGRAIQEFFAYQVDLGLARCPLIENWTATNRLLRIGAARTYVAVDGALEVLYLGWIEREKGIFELLECARQLSNAAGLPPFKIVIAGEGSALTKARREVDSLGLAGIVQFLGWIDSEAAEERLRIADVLVLPSYMEGMPNAVIEAMAAGLPVVATDVGAVIDVVSDGVNGFIIPPRDTGRLVEALRTVMLDAPLRERMGRAGWQIAKEKFSAERAVDQIAALANRVCAKDGSLGRAS